jgi:hypothetical protein
MRYSVGGLLVRRRCAEGEEPFHALLPYASPRLDNTGERKYHFLLAT